MDADETRILFLMNQQSQKSGKKKNELSCSILKNFPDFLFPDLRNFRFSLSAFHPRSSVAKISF